MKPSLRAPVPGSVTSLKLNHWLLERKNVHICGPPGRRRAGGWASAMLRVLKARFKTLFVSAEQNFRRSQQPEQTPLPPSHPSIHPARPPCVPAAFESGEMSAAKKPCTVSRCGGTGRGSGETGLRFKLSSESRKVCVRGAFNGRDSKPAHWCGISDLKLIQTAHSSLVLSPPDICARMGTQRVNFSPSTHPGFLVYKSDFFTTR